MLGFPHADLACVTDAATCKCAVAASLRKAGRRVVLIGDGLSDCCLARSADLVLARGKLLEYCRKQGIAHEPAPDFSAVVGYMHSLASGTSKRAAPARLAGEAHGG
jgi:2-hydroxy-3-keto-5-methylthiopentenyl-1-phosphate phosphatase